MIEIAMSTLPEHPKTSRDTVVMSREYSLIDGVLHYTQNFKGFPNTTRQLTRLVVPTTMVTRVLEANHDAVFGGHLGSAKLYERLRLKYYWWGMFDDVTNWVASCATCSTARNPRTHRAPLIPIPVGEAFERLGVDVVGPLPKSNKCNQYIICFTDYLTKFAIAKPLRNQQAETVAAVLINDVILRYGAPAYLLSDH